MVSSEKDVDMLRAFGLTRSQARVYLAAVQLGVALVSRVSKASGVSREDVYRVSAKLEKMGVIEKLLGPPCKIRAVPVDKALSILIKREQDTANRRVSALVAQKDEVLKRLRARKLKPEFETRELPHFALLSARKEVLSKIKSMMNVAEKEIDVVTSANESVLILPEFSALVEQALQKQVRVRAVLEAKPEGSFERVKNYVKGKPTIELRRADIPLSHYIIVDFKQAFLATSPTPPFAGHLYLWTRDKKCAELVQENFEEIWHRCADSKNTTTGIS